MRLTNIQIDAIIKSRFGDNDIVVKEAMSLVSDLGPNAVTILIYILWRRIYQNDLSFTADEILNSSFIQRTRQWISRLLSEENQADYQREPQVAEDIERLEGTFIERDAAGNFSVPLLSVKSLVVLMLDGDVRYDYKNNDLMEYMLAMLTGMSEPPAE